MNYLPQSETTYKALQSFDDIEAMNAAVKLHKQAHELTQTDRDILDAISRYACKHVGVTYLSKQKLAEEAGYKSRRTAIRSCNRLEALGIIEQYETRRVKGDRRRSSNVIVIQADILVLQSLEEQNELLRDPQEQKSGGYNHQSESEKYTSDIMTQVTPHSHGIEAPNKANSSNTYIETVTSAKPSADAVMPTNVDTVKRGLKHALPNAIYEALAPFYDGQALYDTYGILLRAKASIDRHIMLEDYAERYIDAFYNVIRLYKAGKVRRSLSGLLYVTWERLTAEISRQIQAQA